MKKDAKAKEDVLVLKSGQLLELWGLLYPLNLHGKKLRSKVRFLRILDPLLSDHDKVRKEIIDRHAKKDKEGNNMTIENEDGSKGVQLKDTEKFKKELDELNASEVKIDVVKSNKDDLITIRDVLLNIDEVKAEIQFLYDDVCTSFEKI